MATSIEDCKAYISNIVGQYKFTVVTPEDLAERCWQAVWPIVEQNAGNLDWFAQNDPQFTGTISKVIQDYQLQQHDYDTRDRYAVRKNYPEFIFESFQLERQADGLHAHYVYHLGEHTFTPEVFIAISDINTQDSLQLNDAFLHALFFNFGIINAINYYKLSFSPKFIIRAGKLTAEQCDFFKKLFYHGLEECMYRNELNIAYDDFMEIICEAPTAVQTFDLPDIFHGNLIPVGGGKDSVVTLEALKPMQKDSLCLQYNRNIYPRNIAAIDCAKLAGYSMNQIVNFNLTLDPLMLQLNQMGYYNGHVPFSSCLAFASLIMAFLNQKKYIVLSNEASANEGNVAGTTINHQYSKSFEFERDFDNYVKTFLTDRIHYFSLLRCLNEYQIVQLFIKHPLYLDVFRSCNVGQRENRWCGHCAKCLYVYIMLYPFVPDTKLWQIFGRNMLEDTELVGLLRGLTHPDATKPFDCVGTRQEICYAIEKGLALKPTQRPALYDYYDKQLRIKVDDDIEQFFNPEHNIPPEYLNLLTDQESDS